MIQSTIMQVNIMELSEVSKNALNSMLHTTCIILSKIGSAVILGAENFCKLYFQFSVKCS